MCILVLSTYKDSTIQHWRLISGKVCSCRWCVSWQLWQNGLNFEVTWIVKRRWKEFADAGNGANMECKRLNNQQGPGGGVWPCVSWAHNPKSAENGIRGQAQHHEDYKGAAKQATFAGQGWSRRNRSRRRADAVRMADKLLRRHGIRPSN